MSLFFYTLIFFAFSFNFFFAFSLRFPRIKRPHLEPSLATWGKCCSLSSPKWSLMPLTSPWSLRWVRCGIWQVSPQFKTLFRIVLFMFNPVNFLMDCFFLIIGNKIKCWYSKFVPPAALPFLISCCINISCRTVALLKNFCW